MFKHIVWLEPREGTNLEVLWKYWAEDFDPDMYDPAKSGIALTGSYMCMLEQVNYGEWRRDGMTVWKALVHLEPAIKMIQNLRIGPWLISVVVPSDLEIATPMASIATRSFPANVTPA